MRFLTCRSRHQQIARSTPLLTRDLPLLHLPFHIWLQNMSEASGWICTFDLPVALFAWFLHHLLWIPRRWWDGGSTQRRLFKCHVRVPACWGSLRGGTRASKGGRFAAFHPSKRRTVVPFSLERLLSALAEKKLPPPDLLPRVCPLGFPTLFFSFRKGFHSVSNPASFPFDRFDRRGPSRRLRRIPSSDTRRHLHVSHVAMASHGMPSMMVRGGRRRVEGHGRRTNGEEAQNGRASERKGEGSPRTDVGGGRG